MDCFSNHDTTLPLMCTSLSPSQLHNLHPLFNETGRVPCWQHTFYIKNRKRERVRWVDEEEEDSSVRGWRRRRRRAVESGEAFWAEQELTGPQGRPDQSRGPQRALTTGTPHACYSKAGATRGLPGLHFTNVELNSPCKTVKRQTVRVAGKEPHRNYDPALKYPAMRKLEKL